MFIWSIFQKVGLKFLIYYKASEFVRRKKPKIVKLFKVREHKVTGKGKSWVIQSGVDVCVCVCVCTSQVLWPIRKGELLGQKKKTRKVTMLEATHSRTPLTAGGVSVSKNRPYSHSNG